MRKTGAFQWRGAWYYPAFFLAVALTACFFPPVADDLAWAGDAGMELFRRGFADYNGRYLGNLCALVFTRLGPLLPLVKALVLTGLLWLLQKLYGRRDAAFLCLSAIVLLFPGPLFSQAFLWTAGFSNYTVSVLLMMACVWLVFFRREAAGWRKAARYIAVCALGFAGQLFMEPFTLFSLIVSLASFLYWYKKKKGFEALSFVYFLSCAAGAAVMFSNGVYGKVLQGADVYQKLAGKSNTPVELILNAAKSMLGAVPRSGLAACFPALILIAVLSLLLVRRRQGIDRKIRLAVYMLYGLSLVFLCVYLVQYARTGRPEAAQYFTGLFCIAFAAAAGLAAFHCLPPPARGKTGLLFLAFLLLTGPLCFVDPVGPRCFSGASVVLLLIAGEFFAVLRAERKPNQKSAEAPARVLLCLLAALCAWNLFCYSQAYCSNEQKIESIRAQAAAGRREIRLPHTKFHTLIYALDGEVDNQKLQQYFCDYYGLPREIKIVYDN